MNRIGVLTSGGDAPGMNAAIRAVVRTAIKTGLEIFGIRRGYQGIIDDDMVRMDHRSVSNIIQTGGSILVSSRCDAFMQPDGRQTALRHLKSRGLEGLIAIGGNGTLAGAHAFYSETQFPIVGVPGTIDRDVNGTESTIGYDTAVNTALDAIDKIRDTASAMERVFIVEVMGRHCGDIALMAGVSGGAEAVLVPEIATDYDRLIREIQSGFAAGKRTNLIVVAEGDDSGGGLNLQKELEKRAGLKSWVCILGHTQRGGSPSAADRFLATALGVCSVQALIAGRFGIMVGWRNDRLCESPLDQVVGTPRPFNPLHNEFLTTLL
ncbi:MAG: 6-phosphofructokinase [candidate division Zixibacteria bacterium]|nr:6-phosphofructokinase [candidate division Zixibacteria bacterium]